MAASLPEINSPLKAILAGGYITQRTAQECADAVKAAYPPRRRPSVMPVALGQFPDPLPEEKNPAALFKRGWLRKGGGAFVVAPSGVGKSVWSVQAAICWALGKPCFGIEPVRPLKVLVIQAEDDANEIAEFRNAVRHGLVSEYGLDEGDIDFALGKDDPATGRVLFHKAVGKCGEEFVDEVGALLDVLPDVDLVVVNPFQAYFGGDCAKNAELSRFLRVRLDAEIKDPTDSGKDRAAVMFIHHTNKPPNDKDLRDDWGNDQFAAYIGAGGAEIVNWARAILSLMPAGVPGVYRFIAGKRGQRLNWTDASGKRVYCKILKHAENGAIYWREGTAGDEAAVAAAGERKGRRGAVGGDGNGGVPPRNNVSWTAKTVLSYVACHPGLSSNQYCGLFAGEPGGPSRGTSQKLLAEAVQAGLLSLRKEGNKFVYDVTDEGSTVYAAGPDF